MAQDNSVRLTRNDLVAAAWQRFEAARDAFRAKEALAAAAKPFNAARDAYQKAAEQAEKAARNFENMEQRMLLQETGATPLRAAKAVAS